MENKKLLKEEITKLQELQQKNSSVLQNLGYLDIIIEQQKNELKAEYVSIQAQLNELGKQLQDKYGEGNINLETGEFEQIPS